MRKLLRTMSLVAVALLVVSMALTGCSTTTPSAASATTAESTPTPAETTTESVAPTATATATPAIDTSAEVHLYGYLLGAALPGMPDVMTALNAKLKADINATMEINYIGWSDLTSKYPLILAAGENVDWIYTAAWCQMATQSAKGAFMEMTPELYATYMPLHWAKIKDTTAIKECSINGKDYMIPTSTPDKKVPVVLYRKDLATKYGIGDLTKFSDIEPFLAAVKKNDPDMVPINMDSTYDLGTPLFNLFTEANDVMTDITMVTGSGCGLYYKIFDKDGALYQISSDTAMLPGLTTAAQTMKKWYDAGYINHDAFANKVRSKESLVAGKSAVAFGNSIDVQGNLTSAKEAGMEIGIIPILGGASGKNAANAYTNNGVAIAAKSKNWERALMAMDLIMEEESYVDLVYYGEQDKNYKLTADGKLDYTGIDATLYPVDQAGFWFVDKDYFKPSTSWTEGYTALQSKVPGYIATDTLAAFSPDLTNVKSQIANLNQVLTQYLNPIDLGAVSNVDEAFKTLDKNLNSAGIADVNTELSKQIEAYLATMK